MARYRYKRSSNKVPVWVVALGVLGVYYAFLEGRFVSFNVETDNLNE